MDTYANILLKRIIGYIPIVILGVIAIIAIIVVTKKMDLPKFLYLLALVLAIFFGVMLREWIFIILDFNEEAYIIYNGEFEVYTAEGTNDRFMLHDEEETILFSPKAEHPNGTYEGEVVYSKRSRILLDAIY